MVALADNDSKLVVTKSLSTKPATKNTLRLGEKREIRHQDFSDCFFFVSLFLPTRTGAIQRNNGGGGGGGGRKNKQTNKIGRDRRATTCVADTYHGESSVVQLFGL